MFLPIIIGIGYNGVKFSNDSLLLPRDAPEASGRAGAEGVMVLRFSI